MHIKQVTFSILWLPILTMVVAFPCRADNRYATSTTVSIDGRPARGATINVNVSVSGRHQAIAGLGTCEMTVPGLIKVYDGNALIDSVLPNKQNTTPNDQTYMQGTGMNYACATNLIVGTGTLTKFSFSYKIPSSSNQIQIRATFNDPDTDNWGMPSQSQVISAKFPVASAAAINYLLNN
ncbi:hypothetical protein [Dyella silvatica]|uniref:hypothetical protein n=1 Tax=Dyella silvatica TaxID=2992128 RepID=UPI00225B6BAF|nr:hypothetical protein [Dyella silvatica]